MTFWKKQNFGEGKKISVSQGLWMEGWMKGGA
jgi:hypothetical protein